MGRLSASKMALAQLCAFPFRADAPWIEVPRDVYSAKGTVFAALTEGAANAGELVAALSPDDRAEVESWQRVWRESVWSQPEWRHEVAFAFDPATGAARVLETAGHRDYSQAREGELVGTADLVHVADGLVTVADQKTGRQVMVHGPIAEHAQLRTLATMAARALGCDRAQIVALYCDADGVHPEAHDLDLFDLDAEAAALAALMQSVPTAQPRPGAHCGDCPAASACPVASQAVDELAAIPKSEPVTLDLTTPERAATALFRVRAAEAAVEQIRAALREYADANGGIPTGDGRVWRACVENHATILVDGEAGELGMQVLATHGLTRAAVTERSVTKKALEEAIRASGAKVAPTMRAVMAELEAAGAVRVSQIPKYRETKQ